MSVERRLSMWKWQVVVAAQIFTANEVSKRPEASIAGAAEKVTLKACEIRFLGDGR